MSRRYPRKQFQNISNKRIIFQGEDATEEEVDSVMQNLQNMEVYVNDSPEGASEMVDSLSQLKDKFDQINTQNDVDLVSINCLISQILSLVRKFT